MIIRAKTKGRCGTKVKKVDDGCKYTLNTEDVCEVCEKPFKDDDEIISLDGPLIHDDECFLEWSRDVYGIPVEYATYKIDKQNWEGHGNN